MSEVPHPLEADTQERSFFESTGSSNARATYRRAVLRLTGSLAELGRAEATGAQAEIHACDANRSTRMTRSSVEHDESALIGRAEARARGLKHFFTGKPCKRGHVSRRITSSAACIDCKRMRDATDKYRDKAAQYREVNRGAERDRTTVHRITVRMGRPLPAAYDREACEAFYAACPEGMQVDHVVPLNGEFVSGLHVSWNLQYMTPEQNGMKGNAFCHDAQCAANADRFSEAA